MYMNNNLLLEVQLSRIKEKSAKLELDLINLWINIKYEY